MSEEPFREIMRAAALIMRMTGERWAELVAREDLSEQELEGAAVTRERKRRR